MIEGCTHTTMKSVLIILSAFVCITEAFSISSYDYSVSEEYSSGCAEADFQCRFSGICLPEQLICNGEINCGSYDASDEFNCPSDSTNDEPGDIFTTLSYIQPSPTPSRSCRINDHHCDSRTCIPRRKVCNGVEDCFNGSDEVSCSTTPPPISSYDYPSNDFVSSQSYVTAHTSDPCYNDPCGQWGTCISNFIVWLFITDGFICKCVRGYNGKYCQIGGSSYVIDYHSEYSSGCAEADFQCLLSGICLPEQLICNGDINCGSYDASDEFDCPSDSSTDASGDILTTLSYIQPSLKPLRPCGINDYHCDSSTCIPRRKVCNGVEDCFDGSDEVSCSTTPPPLSSYSHSDFSSYVELQYSSEGTGTTNEYANIFTTAGYIQSSPKTSEMVGPCNPDPCGQWGVCNTNFIIKITGGDFECDCFKGHSGKYCEIDLCASHTCLNNGQCEVSWLGTPKCECPDLYDGDYCEIDLCDNHNCVNNGQCELSWVGNPRCKCPDSYVGDHCEHDCSESWRFGCAVF